MNSDGISDYIILTGSYGSAGSEIMLLASGADGKHREVFREYMQEFRFEDSHSKWKTFVTENYHPNDKQQCPESSNGAKMYKSTRSFEFNGAYYQFTRQWEVFPNPPCIGD